MDANTKVIIGSVVATLAIIVGAAFLFTGTPPQTASAEALPANEIIRDAGYNSQGPDTAPVTIVEFSDLQCPACQAFSPVLKALVEQNPQNVRLVYRHFPLPQHPLARPAALAAEAAGQQGKFWEYHDLVFENQQTLTDDSFEQFATQLELDMEQFNAYRDSEEAKATLQTDLSYARTIGVTGTPTIYINGIKMEARSLPELQAQVESIVSQANEQFGTEPQEAATTEAQPITDQESSPSADQ